MNFTKTVPSPKTLFQEYPIFERQQKMIKRYRHIARRVFAREDHRVPVIVGPCSIHSVTAALEYARRLSSLLDEVSETLFPIMRVYVEKPRTTIGWKGLLYDPYLNGTNNMVAGIQETRSLLTKLADLGIPCATEFVSPLTAQYFKDLITWGFIGARTTASQTHRELASALKFPVGFKNSVDGNLQIAIDSVVAARAEHTFLSLNDEGKAAIVKGAGNPFTHLVLRGSDTDTNYSAGCIEHARRLQEESGLFTPILVDCAHGNSKKNPDSQKEVFFEVAEQIAQGNRMILGLMVESYLDEGSQTFDHKTSLSNQVSITDPCISWNDTETLLRWLDSSLKKEKAEKSYHLAHTV